MQRLDRPAANRPGALGLIAAVLMLLAIAAPVGAATTGTICGEVEEFSATTLADGTITFAGRASENVLAGAVDATTAAQLAVFATLGAFTCVNVEAVDGGGNITALSFAAQGELCGTVTESAGVFFVNGTALTAEALTLIGADSTLAALLNAAAAGGASVCLDFAFNSAGLVTSVNLDATVRLCGTVTLDADSATVGGVDVPLSLLSAEAAAALQVAVDAGVNACIDVTVVNTDVVNAAVDVTVELCGTVTFNADGSATIDGVTIPADVIDADLAAALEATADAAGEACVTIDAVSSGGETIVTVVAGVSLCATVEAITATTITAGGVTFPTATDLRAVIQVGDDICFELVTDPDGGLVIPPGGVITDPTGTPITDPDGSPADDDDDAPLLPDTALAPLAPGGGAAALVLLVLMAMAVAAHRLERERLER